LHRVFYNLVWILFPQLYENPFCFTQYFHSGFFFSLSNCRHSSQFRMASHCIFHLHFLDTDQMTFYLIHTHTSSLVNHVFNILASKVALLAFFGLWLFVTQSHTYHSIMPQFLHCFVQYKSALLFLLLRALVITMKM
jgi:hypothetical protein